MNHFIFKVSSTTLLLTGLTGLPRYANADDTSAPVPAKANENDPDSQIYRASDVIGLPVKDDQKQEIGKIKDLVINGSSREVLYAVVAMNDGKEKDSVYVMPWTQFQPSFGQGSAIQYTVLTVPQSVWLQAPYWTMAQWRQMPYSQWSPRVNKYYEGHNQTNTASNSKSSSVSANKPVLNADENKKKSPAASEKDKPEKETKPQPKNEKSEEKEKTDQPKSKPASTNAPAPSTTREPKSPAPK